MMTEEVDVLREKLYMFADLSKKEGIFPWPVHYSTIWRYAKEGRTNRSGITVFLEYVKTPSGYATSREACRRFLRDLNS